MSQSEAAAYGGGAAGGIEIGAALVASLGDVAAEMRMRRHRELRLSQNIWALAPGPIPVPDNGSGVGTVDKPTVLGPRTGQAWSIHRISTTGWTTGTISVFMDSAQGELLAYFAAGPAVQTFGKGVLTLTAGSRLVIVGAVTGGNVTAAAIAIGGVQMAADLLADYLL